ncbi:hypothetical protein [Dyadobacter sp. 676]|uniref:Uncharacterized protein n=1 Tax=Dyadobacter sp. 676 TaxID=3088362 RepID=A0AAU8FEM4_9BACT
MAFKLCNLTRLLSVFLLITSLLVLSYCPLRKTVQSLLTGTRQTEQSAAQRYLASAACQGTNDSSGTKVTIGEPKPGIDTPVLKTRLFAYGYLIRRFSFSERGFVFGRKISIAYLNSIPIYLKNRILLI